MVRGDAVAEIAPFGDAAYLVRFGDVVSPRSNARALALADALGALDLPGLRDLTPAYASLLVQFDPLVLSHEAVAEAIQGAVADTSSKRAPRGRLVRISVAYGGSDGPDLEDVARLTGLTPEEVVERHAAATYRVYFLGFLAGFPYLGGLPAELAVSRLAQPRAHVPAGSVGIAERQTGVYPAASPGGWRLIGRTEARLFDPMATPPALLRPGDRVRFVPSPPSRPRTMSSRSISSGSAKAEATRGGTDAGDNASGSPYLRVLRSGPLTTVQDLGRWGQARYGVSRAGAADEDALRLGNALLGNAPGSAALEITLGGCAFEALDDFAVVLTGADCAARLDGDPVAPGRVVALARGQTLELGAAMAGVRCYLCMAGGVQVPFVMGSRSTDLRAGLGGQDGRALRAGDVVFAGAADARGSVRAVSAGGEPGERASAGSVVLRVLPGPRAAGCVGVLDTLQAAEFVVDPLSDRMGVRLRRAGGGGRAGARPAGGQVLSHGVTRGAVQLPPGGEPIVLLADAQTTGGYAVPAVVIGADLGRLAQLRPGERVRFATVTLDEALDALRERRRALEEALRGAATAQEMTTARQPSRWDVLASGFAEWSDAADLRR